MTAQNALIPEFFQIKSVIDESPDVFSLTLSSRNQKPFYFEPGQFNMLMGLGIGEAAISISSSPHVQYEFVHTIRAVGQVTNHLRKLKRNDQIALRGPFGQPWPYKNLEGKSILLIAGGIGLAPLRSLLYQLTSDLQVKMDITLIYGARTPKDLIFKQELESWNKKINVLITVDHSSDQWNHHVGALTHHIPKSIKNPKNTIAMMCGPEIMMRFSYFTLLDEGILPEQIYISMERNMQCGIGQCGHCQWGPFFVCKDGPVMNFKTILPFFFKKEL